MCRGSSHGDAQSPKQGGSVPCQVLRQAEEPPPTALYLPGRRPVPIGDCLRQAQEMGCYLQQLGMGALGQKTPRTPAEKRDGWRIFINKTFSLKR